MHTLREERPFDAGKWLEALNRKERKMEPFSREEWDQILGHHEVRLTTSSSSPYLGLLADIHGWTIGCCRHPSITFRRRVDFYLPRGQGHPFSA